MSVFFLPIGTLAGLTLRSLFVGIKMSKHFSTNLYKTTGGCSINHFWTDALNNHGNQCRVANPGRRQISRWTRYTLQLDLKREYGVNEGEPWSRHNLASRVGRFRHPTQKTGGNGGHSGHSQGFEVEVGVPNSSRGVVIGEYDKIATNTTHTLNQTGLAVKEPIEISSNHC